MTTTVYGVDFSGATDAGNKLWVTQARLTDTGLIVERCLPARDLSGGGRDRVQALAALRMLIATADDAVFGMDVPLCLPPPVMGDESWCSYVRGFADAYPSAEAFRDSARASTGGRELRRDCERGAKVPFAAYNLRLYRQTYHALRDVVAPLVTAGQALVLPLQLRRPGCAALVEVCPASTLQAHGLYDAPYKTRQTADRRAALLDWLAGEGVTCSSAIRAVVRDNPGGDALDSLIAAYATAQALRRGDFDALPSAVELREGRIYF